MQGWLSMAGIAMRLALSCCVGFRPTLRIPQGTSQMSSIRAL